MTIYNLGTLVGLISIISFLAKHYHDSRKSEKILHQDMHDVRKEIYESESRVTEKIHESESRVTEKIHESERRISRDIRELSGQVAEHRGILKATGTHPS